MSKPKASDNKADSLDVLEWTKKRGVFSTRDVADHFKIRLMQAASNIAILRIKEVVMPVPKPERSKDQSSRWQYCGG
jgi:hypothetical protein